MPRHTPHARLPSRSPPRITSSAPEMVHHVVKADFTLPESPVEEFCHPAATPEDHLDGQRKAQVSIPNVGEKTFAKTHGTTERPKSKTIRVKAQRSQPRLLTLIACVSYLLFHLMGIDIGLRAIQAYTEPRLRYAEAQLSNTTKTLAVDYLVNIQLHNLLDNDLDRRYLETTYEECLARGLHKANHVFRGLDFTANPHIRNQTADWVTHNCLRLLYTPRVHRLRTSVLQAKADDIRHALGKVLRTAKYRLALLQHRLRGGNFLLATKPVVMPTAIKLNKPPRVIPDMPYGFGLECKKQSRCGLVYTGSTASIAGRKTLEDDVADARKQVFKWSWRFEKVYGVIDCCYGLSVILESLLVMTYLLVSTVASRRPQSSEPKPSPTATKARVWKSICVFVAHLQPGEVHAIGLIINTALHALLGFQLKYFMPEFDRVWLPVGLGYSVFHFVHVISFTCVGSFDESLHNALKAVKELNIIAQGVEVLPEPTKRSVAKSDTPATSAKPASKIAGRFVSPLTPISKDLQQERKAIHREQGKTSRDYVEPQYGYATESDSEYDSDVQHSSYVDLAGGATPTEFEGEDDLVIVES